MQIGYKETRVRYIIFLLLPRPFPVQHIICSPSLSSCSCPTYCMPDPLYLPAFDRRHDHVMNMYIIELLTLQLYPASVTSSTFGHNIFLITLSSDAHRYSSFVGNNVLHS
jgi:hypothetical protein